MITCGRCTKEARETIKHDSVAEVCDCYAAPTSKVSNWEAEEAQAQAAGELWAENAWLRAAEQGIDDGFDEWERSRGVVDFSTARELAEGVR